MEQRQGFDRRRRPRGGRRDTDASGFSPLVMVVESDGNRRTITEAILARSRFAVAPVPTVDAALAICRGLAPTVIVCNAGDASQLRAGLHPLVIPLVASDADAAGLDGLLEDLRAAIRGTRPPMR